MGNVKQSYPKVEEKGICHNVGPFVCFPKLLPLEPWSMNECSWTYHSYQYPCFVSGKENVQRICALLPSPSVLKIPSTKCVTIIIIFLLSASTSGRIYSAARTTIHLVYHIDTELSPPPHPQNIPSFHIWCTYSAPGIVWCTDLHPLCWKEGDW